MKNKRHSDTTRGLIRYAAKLLFQFRVVGHASRKRTCEIRTINFCQKSPRSALKLAMDYGRQSEFEYPNSDGDTVRFEFIGVMDIRELITADELGCRETWYDIGDLNSPIECQAKWIPSHDMLIRALSDGPSREQASAAWRLAVKRKKSNGQSKGTRTGDEKRGRGVIEQEKR